MNAIHKGLWFVPIAGLALAPIGWPYSFYLLLRVAVFGCLGYLAWRQHQQDGRFSGWVALLGAVALLFNPVIPVHGSRAAWLLIDLACAGMVFLHYRAVRAERIELVPVDVAPPPTFDAADPQDILRVSALLPSVVERAGPGEGARLAIKVLRAAAGRIGDPDLQGAPSVATIATTLAYARRISNFQSVRLRPLSLAERKLAEGLAPHFSAKSAGAVNDVVKTVLANQPAGAAA